MPHAPKTNRSIDKLLALPDHDLMENIFGKRIMKELDKEVAERSDDPKQHPKPTSIKAS